jgi:hypothetical protein
MLFSLGAGADVVVVVVVVVVSGAFASLPQAAVIAPIAMMAETPEMAASRRLKRRGSMVCPYLCHDGHGAARETPSRRRVSATAWLHQLLWR